VNPFWRFVLFACAVVLLAQCFGALGQSLPPDASRYKRDLIRNARLEWGLDAPTATFGAQIHQESGWRADVRSHAGAEGIAQFMPATAQWLTGVAQHLGPADAFSPAWAIRAMVAYDRYLYERVDGLTHCERMAKTLASYNGGLGNLNAEQKEAERRGIDTSLWFDGVERADAGRRSAANFAENRGYPRRILRELEPRYRANGWGIHSC
jgi:soluble lytic murein transglycosylase-like protein